MSVVSWCTPFSSFIHSIKGYILRILFTVFILVTALYSAPYTLVVPQEALQERLSNEFPIVHKTMFLSFHVAHPVMSLDGQKQRLFFSADITVPNIQDESGEAVSAKASLSSRIAYSKGGNLYVKKIKVLSLESKHIGKELQNMLRPTIEEALNSYFKSRPIYALKNEKGMVGMAVQSIKNVVIVEKGVKVIFDLGQ